MDQNNYNGASDKDLILIGKLFLDYVTSKGHPLSPKGINEQKKRLAKLLETSEDEVVRIYLLMTEVATKQTTPNKQCEIGFINHIVKK